MDDRQQAIAELAKLCTGPFSSGISTLRRGATVELYIQYIPHTNTTVDLSISAMGPNDLALLEGAHVTMSAVPARQGAAATGVLNNLGKVVFSGVPLGTYQITFSDPNPPQGRRLRFIKLIG